MKDYGFSLIEQLVALFVLSIAVLSIVPFLSSNLYNIKREDYKVKASNLAQEMIEAARSAPFDELVTGTYSTSGPYPEPSTSALAVLFTEFENKITDSSYIPSGSGYMAITTADEITTSAYMREIIIGVEWIDRGTTQSYELPTYIYKVAGD